MQPFTNISNETILIEESDFQRLKEYQTNLILSLSECRVKKTPNYKTITEAMTNEVRHIEKFLKQNQWPLIN